MIRVRSEGRYFLPGLNIPAAILVTRGEDEALTMGAEIISEPGNDVALAGGQSFQSRARNFFGGLGFAHKLFLAGNSVEFGFGRPRAKRTHANSVLFHLFGETSRKSNQTLLWRHTSKCKERLERSG